MRKLAIGLFALSLAALPAARAGGGPGDGKSSEKDKRNDSAATQPSDSKLAESGKPAVTSTTELASELEQLRMLLASQAKQLEEQQRELAALKSQLAHDAAAANTIAASAGAAAAAAPGATAAVAANADQMKEAESPAAIHFKGITITPGGFLAAESVFRNKGITSDVNTDFKGVPFSGASNSQLTEYNLSGRQSRLSMLAEGKIATAKLSGYVETDFLSAGTTSNNNESNSYTLRVRQAWGQAALDNGWAFTGGQMWSLVTETRKALDNRTEATPLTIDPQYTIGFSWARQFGFRVTKNFANTLWLGLAVESPQTTFGGRVRTQNLIIAAPGDLSGLYNNQANYSFNKTPDFILKAAWEPGWGHYEVFGVVGTFRSRIFPCASASAATPCVGSPTPTTPSAFGADNNTVVGGGAGGNARFPFFNNRFQVALHGLWGDGVGRYGTATLADVTAHPDGTLVPIRGGQALLSLEWHPTPNIDIYGNGGGEYAARTAYVNAAGLGVGYGSLLNTNAGCLTELLPTNQNTPTGQANCQGDIRTIIEGTFGFWHRFYSGPKGKLAWGLQYSYVTRNSWSATAGGAPHGIDNMVFSSFRYYLP